MEGVIVHVLESVAYAENSRGGASFVTIV